MRRVPLLVSFALVLAACGLSSPLPTAPVAPGPAPVASPAPLVDGKPLATTPTPSTGTIASTPGPASGPASAEAQSAVAASDRDPKDTALDAGRHPAEMLSFFGIGKGMKVAELFAGGGYTTELLARTVGPTGVVYGENPKGVLEKFAAKPWGARLAKPVNANVKRADRELDDPLPAEAKDLDAIVMVLTYHDSVWLKADRDKMNKAVFAALKPGGVYGIVDHSARAGSGTNDVQTLHRIDEKSVVDEVQKAGFKLAGEADFLRNPSDTRDWNASPREAGEKRGTSDRFVLKFVKP